MVLCFVAFFVQLNNIQIFKSSSLANDPKNPREFTAEHDQPRGDILPADGIPLATSVPSQGTVDKYKRLYDSYTATLFPDSGTPDRTTLIDTGGSRSTV